MESVFHYSRVLYAVLKDFYIFGGFVWCNITLYVRALYEVMIELWDEFFPKQIFDKMTLPSLEKYSKNIANIEESPRLLLLLILAAPAVLLIGTLWFLFVLVFIGA